MNSQIALKTTIALTFSTATFVVSPTINAEEHSLSIGHSVTSFDYFEAYPSEFNPSGLTASYSYEISSQWLASLSFAELSKSEEWVAIGQLGNEARSFANQETEAFGVGFSWLGDDYSLSFSYSVQTNDEVALARFPAVIETIDSDIKALNFSYDSALTSDDWELGYGIGLQYLDEDSFTRQAYQSDPITLATADFQQTSWSSFAELDISYWFESESFLWAPQLSLGWNWEISSKGEPLFLVSRGDERVNVSRFSDRVIESFKTPDAGYWEIGAYFQWESGWNLNISTGKTLSSEPEITTTNVEVGVYF